MKTLKNKWEYSFQYGKLFGAGPKTFSGEDTLRIDDMSNSAGTFLVPWPMIGFHTHFDAEDMLSQEDLQAAGDNPLAAFDIDRGKFRCAARTGD